jgi:hypothetical protein
MSELQALDYDVPRDRDLIHRALFLLLSFLEYEMKDVAYKEVPYLLGTICVRTHHARCAYCC